MHTSDLMASWLATVGQYAWLLLVWFAAILLHALLGSILGAVLRAWSVRVAIRIAVLWVDCHCTVLRRDDRRIDFRSDLLWNRYRRGRRRGYNDFRLAWYVLRPTLCVVHDDIWEVVTSAVGHARERAARTPPLVSGVVLGGRVWARTDEAKGFLLLGVGILLVTAAVFVVPTPRPEVPQLVAMLVTAALRLGFAVGGLLFSALGIIIVRAERSDRYLSPPAISETLIGHATATASATATLTVSAAPGQCVNCPFRAPCRRCPLD